MPPTPTRHRCLGWQHAHIAGEPQARPPHARRRNSTAEIRLALGLVHSVCLLSTSLRLRLSPVLFVRTPLLTLLCAPLAHPRTLSPPPCLPRRVRLASAQWLTRQGRHAPTRSMLSTWSVRVYQQLRLDPQTSRQIRWARNARSISRRKLRTWGVVVVSITMISSVSSSSFWLVVTENV